MYLKNTQWIGLLKQKSIFTKIVSFKVWYLKISLFFQIFRDNIALISINIDKLILNHTESWSAFIVKPGLSLSTDINFKKDWSLCESFQLSESICFEPHSYIIEIPNGSLLLKLKIQYMWIISVFFVSICVMNIWIKPEVIFTLKFYFCFIVVFYGILSSLYFFCQKSTD